MVYMQFTVDAGRNDDSNWIGEFPLVSMALKDSDLVQSLKRRHHRWHVKRQGNARIAGHW
jgi:hypothetical protein